MNERMVLVLSSPSVRQKAIGMIESAEKNTRVTFTGPKRTIPQNSRLWSALTSLAKTLPYHGMMLTSEDWRTLFMDALWRETRLLPALENDGFVQMRRATSELSVKECEQLISLVYEFGYRHGVVFSVDERDGIT